MLTSIPLFTNIQKNVVLENWDYFKNNGVVPRLSSDEKLVQLKYGKGVDYRNMSAIEQNCRGIIFEVATGKIVANTFPRFPNFGEVKEDVVSLQLEKVVEKLDGTCMVLYHYNNKWYPTTLGSMGKWENQHILIEAMNMLPLELLDKNYTYIFEVVGNTNCHVTKYNFDLLPVFLAKVETQTGETFWAHQLDYPFEMPRTYNYSLEELFSLVSKDSENKFEGWVLHLSKNKIVKLKTESFILGFWAKNDFSAKKVLRELSEKDLNSILTAEQKHKFANNFEDEFYDKVVEILDSVEEYFAPLYEISNTIVEMSFTCDASRDDIVDFFRGYPEHFNELVGITFTDFNPYTYYLRHLLKGNKQNV